MTIYKYNSLEFIHISLKLAILCMNMYVFETLTVRAGTNTWLQGLYRVRRLDLPPVRVIYVILIYVGVNKYRELLKLSEQELCVQIMQNLSRRAKGRCSVIGTPAHESVCPG